MLSGHAAGLDLYLDRGQVDQEQARSLKSVPQQAILDIDEREYDDEKTQSHFRCL